MNVSTALVPVSDERADIMSRICTAQIVLLHANLYLLYAWNYWRAKFWQIALKMQLASGKKPIFTA